MGFQISKYASIAEDALMYRGIRQDMIAGNIANVDTPFYKAKDIGFEEMLARSAKLLEEKSPTLKLAQTNPQHLAPSVNLQRNKQRFSFVQITPHVMMAIV